MLAKYRAFGRILSFYVVHFLLLAIPDIIKDFDNITKVIKIYVLDTSCPVLKNTRKPLLLVGFPFLVVLLPWI